MTKTSLNDTLPLTLEHSYDEIIDVSDEERTYYGSDISFSDNSKSGSIQILYEVITLESSNSRILETTNIKLCRAILLEILDENIEYL